MKTFTISAAVALLAALAQATPAPNPGQVDARAVVSATLVFYAAAVTTTLVEPATGTQFPINLDSLNIDKVVDKSPTTCTLTGRDGTKYTVGPSATVTIGPPQPLVSGTCHT